MKRRFATLLAMTFALLAGILVGPSAFAQNARVEIPFAFWANQHGLPAGCYVLELQGNNQLHLVDCATGNVVGLMVRTTNAYEEVGRGSLTFRMTARGYRLSHVRFAHINMESVLAVQPKPDQELAKNGSRNSIEIAMK